MSECLGNGYLDPEAHPPLDGRWCGDEGDLCEACNEAEMKYWQRYFRANPVPLCIHCEKRHTPTIDCYCEILRAAGRGHLVPA